MISDDLSSMEAAAMPILDSGHDSLARGMIRVYQSALEAVTAARAPRRWLTDRHPSEWAFTAALRRIGGPVWFHEHDPSGPADDTPLVIARLDPATGSVRYTPATIAEAFLFPAADRFARDGSPIPG
jgi:hypothetical protein